MRMSQVPGRTYGYPGHSLITSHNYYYDDNEGYVADYSESDGLSDGPHIVSATPDVTEIYRRKPTVTPPTEHYQGVYLPSDYYYDHVSANPPPQMRRTVAGPTTTTFRRRFPVVDEIGRYYPTEPVDHAYEAMVFRSSPHIAAVRRISPPRVPSATLVRSPPAVRRHPVTVRTPRYYRRPATLYKQPSALCLPVTCQPDPAVYRRSHRVMQGQTYHHPPEVAYAAQNPKPLTRRHSIASPSQTAASESRKVDSRGDINITNSNLDSVLAKYEKIFSDVPEEGRVKKSESPADKSSNVKNAHILKPKVPLSVKTRQERLQKHKAAAKSPKDNKESKQSSSTMTSRNVERLEVEEVTTDVLDNLLNDLINHGYENTIEVEADMSSSNKETEEKQNDGHGERNSENVQKQKSSENKHPKSFNYHEISQNMSNSHQELHQSKDHNSSPPPLSSRACCNPQQQQLIAHQHNKHNYTPLVSTRLSLDETSALELHRSKSYIVDLIDRALSKELGTMPEEKHSSREFVNMDPKIAVDTMNRHVCNKLDKELCLEITQALTESFVSNATAQKMPAVDSCRDSNCPCTAGEPFYVKQLKQLRWGHLKHIETEVRRLGDLQRFIDSYNSGSSF